MHTIIIVATSVIIQTILILPNMKVYLSAAVLLLGSAVCTSVQASLFDNGEEYYYKDILLQRHYDKNNRQQNSKSSKSTSTKSSKSSSSVCYTLRKRQCKYSHYSDYCSWDSSNRKCEPTTTYADEFAGVMEPDLLTSCDGMRRRQCTDTGACKWDYKERTCVRRRRPDNIRHDPICLNQGKTLWCTIYSYRGIPFEMITLRTPASFLSLTNLLLHLSTSYRWFQPRYCDYQKTWCLQVMRGYCLRS